MQLGAFSKPSIYISIGIQIFVESLRKCTHPYPNSDSLRYSRKDQGTTGAVQAPQVSRERGEAQVSSLRFETPCFRWLVNGGVFRLGLWVPGRGGGGTAPSLPV